MSTSMQMTHTQDSGSLTATLPAEELAHCSMHTTWCPQKQHLVPCHTAWLPTDDSHLARPLERRVWWPEDDKGKPHAANHDQLKHRLTTTHYIWQTSDGKPPSADLSNVLEGQKAKEAHKKERVCGDLYPTYRLYQIADRKCGFWSNRKQIWAEFEQEYAKLAEPDWSFAGLLWRRLYFKAKRPEELEWEENVA